MQHGTSGTWAILLTVIAMACFAVVDAFVKLASESQGSGQVIFISSLATFGLFWIAMWRSRERLWVPNALNPALLIRTAGEVAGSIGIVVALGLAPLSSVIALAQAQPLAVVFGAALFLKEDVGWRRWAAVVLALIGVLMILRPGFSAFDPSLLWVLVYVFGLAMRDLASRRLPTRISTSFAVAWSMVPMALAGALMMRFQGGWQHVSVETAVWYLGMILALVVALWTLTTAMRIAEVSSVAPFRYSRILFALVIAYFVFDEIPDLMTWSGVTLIVGSGLYAFWRERRRAEAGQGWRT